MTTPRTLVVTIDAHHLPEGSWPELKGSVNDAIDRVIRAHCRDGAQVWRRSDDVSILLEDES